MKQKIIWFWLFVVILSLAVSQEKEPVSSEVRPEVPELTQYHKVIYKLWHIMWPAKDVGGISQMFNDIEEGALRVRNAKLPGILRDKQKVWNENVYILVKIVDSLKSAIDKGDSVMILKKVEELHSQYEKLVRIIRPVIKELEEFHQVLYMLYHYYVPEYDVEKIKAITPSLKEKIEKLRKSSLPERLKSKEADFQKKVDELAKEVFEFAELVEGKFTEISVKEKMNKLHSKYQAVEKLFD